MEKEARDGPLKNYSGTCGSDKISLMFCLLIITAQLFNHTGRFVMR